MRLHPNFAAQNRLVVHYRTACRQLEAPGCVLIAHSASTFKWRSAAHNYNTTIACCSGSSGSNSDAAAEPHANGVVCGECSAVKVVTCCVPADTESGCSHSRPAGNMHQVLHPSRLAT